MGMEDNYSCLFDILSLANYAVLFLEALLLRKVAQVPPYAYWEPL